jgi:hypothetical protein
MQQMLPGEGACSSPGHAASRSRRDARSEPRARLDRVGKGPEAAGGSQAFEHRASWDTHQHLDRHATYAFAAWLRRTPGTNAPGD